MDTSLNRWKIIKKKLDNQIFLPGAANPGTSLRELDLLNFANQNGDDLKGKSMILYTG